MSIDELEVKLTRMGISNLIETLRNLKLLKKFQKCDHCSVFMVDKSYKQPRENIVWRCDSNLCVKYRVRLSIRKGFFDPKILLKWSVNTSQVSICNGMDIGKRT